MALHVELLETALPSLLLRSDVYNETHFTA